MFTSDLSTRTTDLLIDLLCDIDKIKDIAGPNLEHYHESIESIWPITTSFEENIANFWQYRLKYLRCGPPHVSKHFFDEIYELRLFCRQLAYAEVGRNHEALEFPFCKTLDCCHDRDSRKMVAGRILWVEQRITGGLPTYPGIHKDRYANLVVCGDSLTKNLSERMRWLVDYAIVPSLETTLLINYISSLMVQERDWESKLIATIASLDTHKISRIPRVEEFTTPCLDFGVDFPGRFTRSKSKQMEKERGPCSICTLAFDTTSSRSLFSKHAVTTRCGHSLCAYCLRSWIEIGKSSCPFCRQNLYDIFLVLPKELSKCIENIVGVLLKIHDLDEDIDRHLEEGPEVEVHNEKFFSMIKKLDMLDKELEKRISGWYILVETAIKKTRKRGG